MSAEANPPSSAFQLMMAASSATPRTPPAQGAPPLKKARGSPAPAVSRQQAFLMLAKKGELLELLEHECDNFLGDSRGKDCLTTTQADNGKDYVQKTIPTTLTRTVMSRDPDLDPSPSSPTLKVSLHMIAAWLQHGPRPFDATGNPFEAHHSCHNTRCFRWTPDEQGRVHINWLSKAMHQSIRCNEQVVFEVQCPSEGCGAKLTVNSCEATHPHDGPSCF